MNSPVSVSKGDNMKKWMHISIAALSLIVCLAVAWLILSPIDGVENGPPSRDVDTKKTRLVRRSGKRNVNARQKIREIVSTEAKDTKRARRLPAEMFANLKGADRKLAENIQNALDNGDYAGIIQYVDAAMRSENAEVRSHLVDALSWFGVEALPELTTLMADSDEDVAESAQTQWAIALAEIESPGKRMAIGLSALSTLTDENMLADISGEVSNAALEYIEGDSDDLDGIADSSSGVTEGEDDLDANAARQGERRVEVVQALLDIIEGGLPACAEAAAETYEEITGHAWAGVDEAEVYLQDPDNYEPPEDREVEDRAKTEGRDAL